MPSNKALKASHKALKGIVRNVTESFSSLTNYCDGDYVMGHIVYQSWFSNIDFISIDLLNGTYSPKDAMSNSIIKSIKGYIKYFPDLVERSGSNISYIQEAKMTISVKSNIKRRYEVRYVGSIFFESPFACQTIIIDDRNKEYRYLKEGWWYPEKEVDFAEGSNAKDDPTASGAVLHRLVPFTTAALVATLMTSIIVAVKNHLF
jgi:hypothetical protein